VSVLLLKRASLSRPSGHWNDDDFDVLAYGKVVGRLFKSTAEETRMDDELRLYRRANFSNQSGSVAQTTGAIERIEALRHASLQNT
jgi:hypothetical protein